MKPISLSILAAGAALLAIAAPAQAADVCAINDIDPTASDCVGMFSGNVLNASNLTTINQALFDLTGVNPGLTNVQFDALPYLKELSGADGDFANPTPQSINVPQGYKLYGDTIIGIHWGGSVGSAFYRLDAGMDGLTMIDILHAQNKSSGLVVFSTESAVPEPASWAMLIAGMGAVGVAMRRRRSAVSFA